MRLFKGIECEGILKGKHTLFVDGDVDTNIISAHLTEDVQHVYFGAGRLSEINFKNVKSVLNKHTVYVTVESFNIIEDLFVYPNLYQMLTAIMLDGSVNKVNVKTFTDTVSSYLEKGLFLERVMVKIDTGKFVAVDTLKNFILNDYSHYMKDCIVWSNYG